MVRWLSEQVSMKRIALFLSAVAACLISVVSAEEPAAPVAKPVSFYRQVRPILQRHCSGCHQPAKQGGNLQLISYELFKKGGENGASFVPGKPDESQIVKQISGVKPEMPLNSDPL